MTKKLWFLCLTCTIRSPGKGVMLLVAHRMPSGFPQGLGLCPPSPSRPPALMCLFTRFADFSMPGTLLEKHPLRAHGLMGSMESHGCAGLYCQCAESHSTEDPYKSLREHVWGSTLDEEGRTICV